MTTYKKKLIEVALPLVALSDASSSEKTLKNSHPANLHMWWARRPLAAARAVLWASLVDDPSSNPGRFPSDEDQRVERKRLFDLLERLVQWNASNDREVLAQARAEIERSCDGNLPTVLDPFAGGGAIPLEALRLGLATFAGDLNPVAVVLQRVMLQALPRFAGRPPVHPDAQSSLTTWHGSQGLAADVHAYGSWVREAAQTRISEYYPPVVLDGGEEAGAIAWIWARTVRSPDPSWRGHVPLVKSWIMAKKPGRPITHIEPIVDHKSQTISYEIKTGGQPAGATVARGNGLCIATGSTIPSAYVKDEAVNGRMGRALLAVVGEGKRARAYQAPSVTHVEAADAAKPTWTPSGVMSEHPQYMGTPRYGLDEWWKLFTSRQLLALTTLVDLLPEVRELIVRDAAVAGIAADDQAFAQGGSGADAYADAIVLLLMAAIDKLADLNNSLARWEPVAECPRQLFGRQAIQMTWDYAEANPLSHSSGSFATILDGIVRTLKGPAFDFRDSVEASVEQRDARARVAEVGTVVISTDPPYYDNVPYADLSDFFYVWMRHGIASILPDEFATLLTPKAEELVADQQRFGSKEEAHRHFEEGMGAVFAEVAKHQDPRYPATVFYAFKAVEQSGGVQVSTGWATFLSSVIGAGLTITATWPIRTENKSRLRGMKSNALASSVVLACRPRAENAPLGTRGEFVGTLKRKMPDSIRVLQQQNIAPVDLAQSAIGPGMAIFSNYSRVIEADGSTMGVATALGLINEVLSEVLSGEESELDADSRFALTWFDQYKQNTGPFGDADLLAKAKDTTVAGVVEAGIAASRDGKVRLLERSELAGDWDPARDRRFTVWETTQYLIRALESSETEAAELLARFGPGIGDRARQLAYLLYGVCDRNNWADEAIAYNMLVTAWPEIARLASATSAPAGGQLSMG